MGSMYVGVTYVAVDCDSTFSALCLLTWAFAEIVRGRGKVQYFAYPFQVADDEMQMNVNKTLSTPLVCAG